MKMETTEKKKLGGKIEYNCSVTAKAEYRYACRPAIQVLAMATCGFIPKSVKLAIDKTRGIYIDKLKFDKGYNRDSFIEPITCCDFFAVIAASKDFGNLISDKGVPTMESLVMQYSMSDGTTDASEGWLNPAYPLAEFYHGDCVFGILQEAEIFDHWLHHACTEFPGLVQKFIESFMASDGINGDDIHSLIDDNAPEIIDSVLLNIMAKEQREGARF